ncbi:fructose-bisphosphate aldolase [Candidatus Woesebacteria bacterium RIFCSPHIGHO2_01_FULL_38_10]|uniref:Fructose-bisphosphate aldolase n=1 Tax=Candidatus Woesebacteria bacterium RIFCSPLOWO2_01_FULL_39_10b TaxID=1802517 RepID=A0A1F8B748_9BACT|nr:MAG: fructose-bisphosphate aldolase [Candidatus Woesebacteria bacterium RIFCSPHIGHO2_01_FULL_38_10]OGM59876.1 MAG: fructose-bisphosphate aldolase [Candidatus Woesebacteria bacterium RIFCSPLOWO2_01_FULL_39_10b]
MDIRVLKSTVKVLVEEGKGILAADESTPTIKRRFEIIGLESTPETNRIYRQLLFTTPGIEEFISGVIMFDETLRQKTDGGIPFPKLLSDRGIISGVKVDKGKVKIPNFPSEEITEGLDGLRERLLEYKAMGASFTKWRAVFLIGQKTPSAVCIESNADLMARFAVFSQEVDLVPIIEPEVLMEGTHDITKSEEVTYRVLKTIFKRLMDYKVIFEGMLLKPNWVHHGLDCKNKASNEKIAEATLKVMKEVVPSQVPGLVFLSGGDSPEESTIHINDMNRIDKVSWQISFSFGRALQQKVLQVWMGDPSRIKEAQKVFYKRARRNSLARTGQYKEEMEAENGE